MSISGGPNIIKDGLIFCVDAADDSSYTNGSSTWYDLSGNGYNGTLINSPTYSSANKGSISFDGVDDSVDCGEFANNLGEMTVGCWVNTTYAGQYYVSLVEKMSNGDSGAGWGFMIYLYGKINFFTQNDGGSEYHFFQVDNPSVNYVGNWTHMYATITGGVNGTIKIYLNGTSQVLTDLSAGVVTNISTISPVVIGGKDGSSIHNYFVGNISEVLIYNRCLSENEIKQNFNATKGRYNL